ncbi:hypothetical protein EV192_103725 [Actinocrispum wychmicini]|uniref:Uncharacterized protein n=1 Tax=Actinocrispum wychmicini TaxID=1213861 RepID=A0A4R2JM46_9PSEU|nr:hypothetical protein EV192_103725 [Actinocrispum wychmicini]
MSLRISQRIRSQRNQQGETLLDHPGVDTEAGAVLLAAASRTRSPEREAAAVAQYRGGGDVGLAAEAEHASRVTAGL